MTRTAMNNTTKGNDTMKKVSYSETIVKKIIKSVQEGATLADVTEIYGVKTKVTIKKWLEKYYTVKKVMVTRVMEQLLENEKVKEVKNAKIHEEITVKAPDKPAYEEKNDQIVFPEKESEIKPVLPSEQNISNEDIQKMEEILKKMKEKKTEDKISFVIDPYVILRKEYRHNLLPLMNYFCVNNISFAFGGHKRLTYLKYNASDDELVRIINMILTHCTFVRSFIEEYAEENNVPIITTEYCYKKFKSAGLTVYDAKEFQDIQVEEKTLDEYARAEWLPVIKKKRGWIGSKKDIISSFRKNHNLEKNDKIEIKTEGVHGDYVFIKEGQKIAFIKENVDNVTVWKYVFKEGVMYEKGYCEGSQDTKELCITVA